MYRRKLLAFSGTGLTIGIAGCTDLDILGSDPETADSPGEAVELYFEAYEDTGGDSLTNEEYLSKVEHLFHSESPYLEDYEDPDDVAIEEHDPITIETIDTEVTEEDSSFDEDADIPDDVRDENAFVEYTIEFSQDGDSESESREMLVTTEDGNWVIYLVEPDR